MIQPHISSLAFSSELTSDQATYIRDQLGLWATANPKFSTFLLSNFDKVKSKSRSAKYYQDVRDDLAELEIAYRLLQNPTYQLTYEPLQKKGEKGCDFRVDSDQDTFNVEVKRVRQSDAMSKYYQCFDELYVSLRAIPSQLIVTLNWNVANPGPEFANIVAERICAVREECICIVHECNQKIDSNGTAKKALQSFPNATLTIEHLPMKLASSGTSLESHSHPLLFTQRESFKFSDLLLGGVRQLSDHVANALVIRLHNETLFEQELPMAFHEIERCAQEGDEEFFRKKRYDGIAEYQKQIIKLSAVVVVTGRTVRLDEQTLNLVWVNPKATMPLQQSHLDFFGNM